MYAYFGLAFELNMCYNIDKKYHHSYYASRETGFYYLQSRYYDPSIGRFINADSFASTGQGFLGYNMFTYCLNNPVTYDDPTGMRVELWPILFGEHDPGFIHRSVQAHIIATGLFEHELYLPGAGRADIYDPETGEIWEIKHGGSTPEIQSKRINDAKNQVARYKNNQTIIPLQVGHAGAFTGAFVINCENISYCVSYDTPEPGVILYYVQQMQVYEPAASYSYSYSYVPKTENAYNWLSAMLIPVIGIGASSIEPIQQKAYAT